MERVLIGGKELAEDPSSLVNRVAVEKQHVLGNTEGHANAAQCTPHFKLHLLVLERQCLLSHFCLPWHSYSNTDTSGMINAH